MSHRSFTFISEIDGLVLSSGTAGNSLQLQAQLENVPAGRILLIGVEGQPGWRWNGSEFLPPLPAAVTAEMVKREQARRLRYTDGYVSRAADPTDGRPIPANVLTERQAIRDGAHRLEGMDPIPADYRDQKYWAEQDA